MKYLILFILLIVSIQVSDAAIINTHPRVWIDSNIKARLQADAVSNTTEWQALKAECDSNLASNNGGVYRSSGYHYLDWYKLVMTYGLCFQATGNQAYGNEGVVYMTGLLRDGADSGHIGDGLGGDLGIRTDSGYVSRAAGVGVAIGRDWLDGASGLTTSIINEANTRMATWWTWISANAHAIDDARDNYFYGHFAMIYTAAFSFYGDTNYQSSWLTSAETMWSSQVMPLIEGGYYDGGDDAKGWNYSPWAYREMVGYLVARDTATDESNPWSVTNIYDDLAKNQVHWLYPNRGHFSDNGMWSGDTKGDPQSTLARMLVSSTPIDATRKGTLKWFVDNLTSEPNGPEKWQKFFYKVSDVSAITPTSSNMGGLSYTTNIGHLSARSDTWSNQTASFVELFAYTDQQSPSSQNGTTNGNYNIGDMRFASRGIGLIEDGAREQYTGHYYNQLYVTGSHTYAPYQESWLHGKYGVAGYPAVSLVTGEGSGYVYGKIKNAQNAYDGSYWTNNPSLAHYDRSMLAIWPDTVVVYDNATATSTSNAVSIRWWFPRVPTISGNTLTTSDTNADLKVSAIGVSGGFATPGTSADLRAVTGTTTYRSGYYYADFKPTGTPTNNQIITVMQATDHGVTPVSVSDITATGGRGVLIGSTAALFTDNNNDSEISTLSYSADALKHYVCDLSPLTEYNIKASGSNMLEISMSSTKAGIIIIDLPNNGQTNMSISKSGETSNFTKKPVIIDIKLSK